MNSLSLLDSFLSRSLSTSRTSSPPGSPSTPTGSSSSSHRRRPRPHSTTPATRTPISEAAPISATDRDSDDPVTGSPLSSGHLPRRNSDYALQTDRARAKRSDRLAMGLQMTTSDDARGSATDDDDSGKHRRARRRRDQTQSEEVVTGNDDTKRSYPHTHRDAQHRQGIRRSDSTPASPGRHLSASGNPPRWSSSLWGIGSWLEAPLSASVSSSGFGITARRRRRSLATASESNVDYPQGDMIEDAEEDRRSRHRSRRRKRSKDSEGDSDGSSTDGSSSTSGSSGSSGQDHDPSYRHVSRLELSGRLLFANRIFTPFHHPAFTASVPNLPSEVGAGVVGSSGLGGMEDVDTVDFEGGESETEEESLAAAATASASVVVDPPALAGGTGSTPYHSSVDTIITTPTQEKRGSFAEIGTTGDYFGTAGATPPDAGPASRRANADDAESSVIEPSSDRMEGVETTDIAGSVQEAELREAREASAALQSEIAQDQRAEELSEAVANAEDGDTATVPSTVEAPVAASLAIGGGTSDQEQRRDEVIGEKTEAQSIPAATPAAAYRNRIGRDSPSSLFRRILFLIRRAILSLLLAPYDAARFVVSIGNPKKRRKIEVSVDERPESNESTKNVDVQSQVEEPVRKKKKRATTGRAEGQDENVDDVVTEEQAIERAERLRHAAQAQAIKVKVESMPVSDPTLADSIRSGLTSKLSRLLPNPHTVDPMLVHEPKAKKITGELPEEIVRKHQRGMSLSLLGQKPCAAGGNSEGGLTPDVKPSPAADGIQSPNPAASPAATPVPRSVVIHHTPKILVLDLDETLIHSTSRSPTWTALRAQHSSVSGRTEAAHHAVSTGGSLLGLEGLGGLLGLTGSSGGRSVRPHMVEVVLEGRSVIYHVYKRPWVDYFLRKVSTWYQVVIFTASVQEYGDPVIDWLDQGRGLIAGRLYRDACTFKNGSYLKDLSIVDLDLSRVCLVDNSPASYFLNPSNGIPIEGWTHDPADEALLDLLPILDSLRFAQDVRHVLGLRITDGKS